MIKYMKQPILRRVWPWNEVRLYPGADNLIFSDFITLREEEVFCVLGSAVFDTISFYAVLTQHPGVGYIVATRVLDHSDIIL